MGQASRQTLLLLSLAVPSCAHRAPVATREGLRSAAESFHRMLRWGDLRGAAQAVTAGRRAEFLGDALRGKADENVKIIDYEILDAELRVGGATVLARVSWHRLPSVVTEGEPVKTEWEDQGGTWFITAIAGGPFALAPAKPAAPRSLTGASPVGSASGR
jgi:hypothetical protein